MVDEVTEELENTETATTETETPSTEAETTSEAEKSEEEATTEVEKTESEIEDEKRRNQEFALKRKTTKQGKENRALKQKIFDLQAKANETKAPIAENYENYDDFIQASIDYGIKKGETKETYNSIDDYASELTANGTAKYADFEQKAYASKEMLPILEEFENAADIAMYMGANPQDAQRIQQMSPVGMSREFARIEVEVNKPKPRTTTAPKPVIPVETTAKTTVDTANESMEQYAARRNKEQYG